MNADHIVQVMQQQLAATGRIGATTIVTVPTLAAAIAASSDSAPQTVRWREPGVVVAMYGQELAGTAAKFAQTEIRVQIGGTEDLFNDGQVGTFVPFLMLFGGAVNWFPITRRVIPGVDWTITYRNADGGATATPRAGFAFLSDAVLANMARGR